MRIARHYSSLYVRICPYSPCTQHSRSDLFLIRPPKGASHLPVNPARIIVAGDSAGGGLTIALLQVLRDCGLPLPSAAVLISPWCDLTHSFPSIHINTASVSAAYVFLVSRTLTDARYRTSSHRTVYRLPNPVRCGRRRLTS